MPLTIRIQTIGLEEGDPIPFFQNVAIFQPQSFLQPPITQPMNQPIASPFITPTLTLS